MAPRRKDLAAQPAVIHGRNAVLEAARAGRVLRVMQATGLGHDPRLDELARLARVEHVPPDRLDAIAPGVHQGVAAELKPRREWTLRDLLATEPSLLVALDSIMDPQNLGAIIRSAEVAGADGAIIPEHRSAPLSPAAVKASSGASELMPIALVSGMPSAVAEVKRSGIWCAALDVRGDTLAVGLRPHPARLRRRWRRRPGSAPARARTMRRAPAPSGQGTNRRASTRRRPLRRCCTR